jgi:hypothetical protein
VAICELNANSHHVGRALANAMIISEMERLGEDRIPLVTSANCLQPDGQNDNGWNQGLLFLNPSQVWLQPPGYVSRMIARHYQPVSVPIRVVNNDQVKAAAARSEDGKVLVLRVVNINNQPRSAIIELDGFTPVKATAAIEELSGPMNATNTADAPNRIVPQSNNWLHKFAQGRTTRVFPPHSFTVMQFE